jgi:hypothetical protein
VTRSPSLPLLLATVALGCSLACAKAQEDDDSCLLGPNCSGRDGGAGDAQSDTGGPGDDSGAGADAGGDGAGGDDTGLGGDDTGLGGDDTGGAKDTSVGTDTGGAKDTGTGVDTAPIDTGIKPDTAPIDTGTDTSSGGPITGGPCSSGATGATAFRVHWTNSGGTPSVHYDVDGLPDKSRWKVGVYGYTIPFTASYVDPFLGVGGVQLDSSDFIDVELSTVGLSSVDHATLAIYGRSYSVDTSGASTGRRSSTSALPRPISCGTALRTSGTAPTRRARSTRGTAPCCCASRPDRRRARSWCKASSSASTRADRGFCSAQNDERTTLSTPSVRTVPERATS